MTEETTNGGGKFKSMGSTGVVENFVKMLIEEAEGRIIACNILDGLEEELYDEAFVRDLFELWKEVFEISANQDSSTLWRMIDKAVFEPPGSLDGENSERFRFAAKGAVPALGDDGAAIVVSTYVLDKMIHDDDKAALARNQDSFLPLRRGHGNFERQLTDFMAIPEGQRFHLRETATVGNPKRCLWYTKKEDIDEVVSGNAEPADGVRDILGLIHLSSMNDDVLAVINLPREAIEARIGGRPTFADAGLNTRFKTRADGERHQALKDWGTTADLARFDRREADIDGLVERVSEPLRYVNLKESLGSDFVLAFSPLGHVKSDRDEDHGAFANHMQRGRTNTVLMERLLEIVA